MQSLSGIHSTLGILPLMSLGVLTSLGDMPSCRYLFMYAQEATGLPQLCGATHDYYCSSWLCEQTGWTKLEKTETALRYLQKSFFLSKDNLTK